MVRPRKCRTVKNEPGVGYFKPRGIPISELEEVVLTVEEFEAIRLSDFEKLNQTEAAKKMNVHQSTFNRMLASSRSKIAEALIRGKAIRIQGGYYRLHRRRHRRRAFRRKIKCQTKMEQDQGERL